MDPGPSGLGPADVCDDHIADGATAHHNGSAECVGIEICEITILYRAANHNSAARAFCGRPQAESVSGGESIGNPEAPRPIPSQKCLARATAALQPDGVGHGD